MPAPNAVARYFSSTFTSLRHRNFQFYCLGVICSLTGSLLQEVVVAWLAYQMTHSSVVLGSILFSFQIPMIFVGILGGWAADKFDRRRTLFVTQSLAFSVSLCWLTLSATGNLAVWHMYVLSAIFGTIVAFEIPARFALVPQLVESSDCMNAFALDSLLFYGGRVAGPAAGALVLTTFGATACFALNSLSYVFEMFTLLPIKPAPRESHDKASLSDGIRATWGNPKVRRILALVAVLTFCGTYIPLMPVFTAMLHGNATVNGFLIAASEFGAMIGSVLLANKTANSAYASTLKRTVGVTALTFAASLALFSLSRSPLLSMLLIVPAGFSMTFVLIGSHALIQNTVDDRMRGIVSTVFWMYSYFGIFAMSGPTMGFLVGKFGVTPTELCAAGACAVAGLLYLRGAGRS